LSPISIINVFIFHLYIIIFFCTPWLTVLYPPLLLTPSNNNHRHHLFFLSIYLLVGCTSWDKKKTNILNILYFRSYYPLLGIFRNVKTTNISNYVEHQTQSPFVDYCLQINNNYKQHCRNWTWIAKILLL